MSTRELWRRLAFLLHRQRHLDDLETEMRLHPELRASKFQHEGLTRAEARDAAERRFGNKTSLKEISTDMCGWIWLDDVLKDVRHTSRMLRANLLFSVVAVLTLALGIGANTAIFNVTNALLLRALPVQNPHQLFYLHVLPTEPEGASNTGNGDESFSESVFERLRTQHQAFSNLLAYVPVGFNIVVTLAASLLPARRAASVDPVVALRYE